MWDEPPKQNGSFTATRWTLVLQAGADNTQMASSALAELCQDYWYPLYAFVRRSGQSPENSQDLTQEFFARLLEKRWLADADRSRGRFRTFLLTALKHFLAKEWERGRAQKRGGGQELIPLDGVTAEERYRLEPADLKSPDALYERRWALELIERSLEKLRDEMKKEGDAERLALLWPTLVGERTEVGYAELAGKIGLTETGVKAAVRRLRLRYREILRAQVAETIGPSGDVDEELQHLHAALA